MMTYTVSSVGPGVARFAIEGELDTVSVTELRKGIDSLIASQPRRVEVDLSLLRMLDSSGVGALVALYKRIRAQGGDVVMTGLRDQPLAIFRLLRLDRVMLGTELAAAGSRISKETSSNR